MRPWLWTGGWPRSSAGGREQCGGEGDEATCRRVRGAIWAETIAGSAIGTPAFMSPEQASGKLDELGPATDVYSLGATLYMALDQPDAI